MNLEFIRHSIFIGILLIMPLLGQTHLVQSLEAAVSGLKKAYAPDRRTAIFDVQIIQRNDTIVITGETNQPKAKKELISECKQRDIQFKDELTILPEAKLGSKTYAVITLSVANIRIGYDHPEELVTQALMGTLVRVLKYYKGWYYIQTPEDYLGWVDDDALTLIDKDSLKSYLDKPKIIVLRLNSVCYAAEDQNSEVITDLTACNILINKGYLGEYYKVEIADGRTGFVKKEDAVPLDAWSYKLHPQGTDIISTAKRFMGIPYLWGGTSSKGVDCSGFTKSVYLLNGIILPRDASQQVLTGELVDTALNYKNFQPGDLVFFGSKKGTPNEKATHVGLYVGDGVFIHSSGRVRLNSFDPKSSMYSKYRSNGFLRAKRFIGTKYEEMLNIRTSPYYFNQAEIK